MFPNSVVSRQFPIGVDDDQLVARFHDEIIKCREIKYKPSTSERSYLISRFFLESKFNISVEKSSHGTSLICEMSHEVQTTPFVICSILWFCVLIFTAVIPLVQAQNSKQYAEGQVKKAFARISLDSLKISKDNANSPESIKAKLSKLDELLEDGVINQDEHKQKRQQVIEEMDL